MGRAEVYEKRLWERIPDRFADPEGNKMRIRQSFLRQRRERREELKKRLEQRSLGSN